MCLIILALPKKVEQKQATETVGARSSDEGGVLVMALFPNFSHFTAFISLLKEFEWKNSSDQVFVTYRFIQYY